MVTKKYIINLAVILIVILGIFPTQSLAAPNDYPCPCSIWIPSTIPSSQTTEALPVELGVKFQSNVGGYITAIRFYKGSGNDGPHYGHLWTNDGVLLGEVLFTNETTTGWQEATLPTPLLITANTTYVASYHSPNGRWSSDSLYFTIEHYSEPLRALASGAELPGNGLYNYGPSGSFPNGSFNQTNYWVDVVFNETVPVDNIAPAVSVVTPTNLTTEVGLFVNVTARFSEAMTAGTINTTTFELLGPSDILVPATVTYVPGSYTATLDPTSLLAPSTTYTATIKGGVLGVTDLALNPLAADYTWTFTTAAPDLTDPTVYTVTPTNTATGINKNTNITARFSEAMTAGTINITTFELRGPSDILVPATVTYVPGSYTATLVPTSLLAPSTTYTATIKGGVSGVTDLALNPLAADYTWTFTTAESPDEGPGGPILVIADPGNPFGRYYSEILRNEGLNEFAVADLASITPTILNSYDVVLLAELTRPLTSGELQMLTNWVSAGGNLIAMRPDKQLAGLLGLTDATGVLPAPTQLYAYLLVDTSQEPGKGIVDQTIQYHGLADLYTLNSGTTVVATLYSNATTPTPNPAVTLRSVGTSGGQAAAFTYDLARSVVYTHQGNPAWAGQDRDPNDPSGARIDSHDLFFGAASWDLQPDYVDFNKITIPQADEQQRLLVNLIQFMNRDKSPLPHFWYFPRGEKAVVIMTGDDHGGGAGTIGRFNIYKAISPVGCSVDNWECIRSSSYMFNGGAMTNLQAAAFTADGFEIGLHVDTGCANWTPTSLESFYQTQLTTFHASYPSLPNQISERTHCITWSDWVTQAKVNASHGIRMDTNYYYYPFYWVNERPGMFTGSGMTMRFADLDGTLIDEYQAVTQITDQSSEVYGYTNPIHIDTLLNNAIGVNGYYGAFTPNMHTDSGVHAGSEYIINAAMSRGVPVVSGKQMVTWLDGRNASSFRAIAWNGGTLSFSIALGTGSNGIQAMVPTSSISGFLTGINRGGVAVSITKQTIKGIEYAFFDAVAGNYAVTYAPDETAPVITNVVVLPATDGTARISWTTDEPSSSQVNYGTTTALGITVSNTDLVTTHVINLTGLTAGQIYYFQATSVDSSANSATFPAAGDPLSFTVPNRSMIDTTVADFSAGSLIPNTYITSAGDGEVTQAPAAGSEFFGSTLPAGWFDVQYSASGSGGTTTVSGGQLTLNGTRVGTNATFGSGRALEFVARFSTNEPFEIVGWGVDFITPNTPWAMFCTNDPGTVLLARTKLNETTFIDTPLGGTWFGANHRYRIEWNASNIIYYIDGSQVASHSLAIATQMRPMAAEWTLGGENLTVDWLHLSPYQTPGTFTSRIWDAVGTADWGAPEWVADLPAGTSVSMSVRTGDTPAPDGTWSDYTTMIYGVPIGRSSRYLQYKAEFITTDNTQTAVLRQVAFGYIHHPDVTQPTIVTRSPENGATGVALSSNIEVSFSEAMNASSISGATIHLRVFGTVEDVPAVVSYVGLTAILNPVSNLLIGTLYNVIVTGSVEDLSSNMLGSDATWSFTTYATGSFTDNTFSDFNNGTPGTGTYVSETTDGEVILKPEVGAEFSGSGVYTGSGTVLPGGWILGDYKPDADPTTATFNGGQVTLDSARLYQTNTFTSGHWLEFVATFNNGWFQSIGFMATGAAAPWAMFGTAAIGDNFLARTTGPVDTPLVSHFGTSHRYRVEWNSTSVVYYVDGIQVDSDTATIPGSMSPMPAAYGGATGKTLSVNWLRMGPYADTGTFTSRNFDAGKSVTWTDLSYNATIPSGTSLTIYTQTSSNGIDWSTPAIVITTISSPPARYLRYLAAFDANGTDQTPTLENVTLTYNAAPTAVTLTSFTGASHLSTVQLNWQTANEVGLVGFNVWSSESLGGPRQKQNTSLLPASNAGQMIGSTYQFSDVVNPGKRYYYWLELVQIDGSVVSGPVMQATDYLVLLPVIVR